MNFGLTLYFLYKEHKTSLDIYMYQLQQLLLMHEHHIETTTSFYRKEYLQSQTELKTAHDISIKAAGEIYKTTYESVSGSEDDRHAVASNEAGYQELVHYHHIDEEQLKRRFTEMADYFNKSSLVITYALFENQLRRFCELLQEVFKKRISVHDLDDRNYTQTCLNYLDKVIELPVGLLKPYESNFKNLQYLRNRIMHNGGEFTDEPPELLKIIKLSNEMLQLVTEEEPYDDFENDKKDFEYPKFKTLRIRKVEYVNKYFDTIRQFFQELFWITDAGLNHEILRGRLAYLTGYLNKTLQVSNVQVSDVKKGKQIKAILTSEDFDDLFEIQCTITLTNGSDNHLSIIDQVEKNQKLAQLIDHINSHQEIIFERLLYGFNLADNLKIVSIIFS